MLVDQLNCVVTGSTTLTDMKKIILELFLIVHSGTLLDVKSLSRVKMFNIYWDSFLMYIYVHKPFIYNFSPGK